MKVLAMLMQKSKVAQKSQIYIYTYKAILGASVEVVQDTERMDTKCLFFVSKK